MKKSAEHLLRTRSGGCAFHHSGFIWSANRIAALCCLAATLVFSATDARAQVTLNVINNFAETLGGTYFGGHIENQNIALYFTNIGATDVTYNSGGNSATSGDRIWLSDVVGGSFALSSNINAGRVYAVLGSSAPASIGPSGPPITGSSTYSYIEISTVGNGTADQSFINQVAFPTKLTNGSQTQAWNPSTTASGIASAFHSAFPTAPYAPASPNVNAPTTPSYDPYFATSITRNAGSNNSTISGQRIIGPSTNNIPAASIPSPTIQYGTAWNNIPSYNNYLGWLKDHDPGSGWKFAYEAAGFPNSTYTGNLTVTGSNNNYGIQLGNFTYGGTLHANGTMTGGTTVNGTITYAPNNSVLNNLFGPNEEYTGNWTDLVIYAGADVATGSVTTSGFLGSLDQASVLYTVGASLAPGILGSDLYLDHFSNTNYFFEGGLTLTNILSDFFANSEFGGSPQTGFYDQFWFTMLQAGGVHDGTSAGYFVPYNDHFSDLQSLIASDSGTVTWELGIVPEPSVLTLLVLAGATFLWRGLRRSNTAGEIARWK